MKKIRFAFLVFSLAFSVLMMGCDQISDLIANFGGEETVIEMSYDDITLVEGETAELPLTV
jgi:hypothetical protein